MVTPTQPVPSRDALRTLRNLAFSNPAAAAGATVGACCLVAVQYETHRRLQLARKLLDTKSQIHSLSNGKRHSHVERMFQKAENGEDFLARPAGAPRRPKRHSSYATAAMPAPEHDSVTESAVFPNVPLPPTQPPTDLHAVSARIGPVSLRVQSPPPRFQLWAELGQPHDDQEPSETPSDVQTLSAATFRDLVGCDPITPFDGPFHPDADLQPYFFHRATAHSDSRFDRRFAECCLTMFTIIFRNCSPEEKNRRFGLVLHSYTQTGLSEDALMAHLLTLRFPAQANALPASYLHELERALLSAQQTRSIAFKRLFPFQLRRSAKHQRPFGLSIQYLKYLSRHYPDPSLLMAHSCAILDAASDANLEPNDQLLLPLIRHLCEAGNPQLAASTLVDASARAGFQPSFYALSTIFRAYALRQDWSSVDDLLRTLHERDWSRQKVHGFAASIKVVLTEYARHHNAEDVYDFLTYYIQSFGLIPTSQLSSVAICAFVRQRRFDLVQRWVRERDSKFADLLITSETHQAALDIACTWRDMDASTNDILKTCQALASGAVHDPFSYTFRAITVEAICADLFKHAQAVEQAVDGTIPLPPVNKAPTLTAAYTSTYELVMAIPKSRNHNNPRIALLVDTLVSRMKAALEVNRVFSGAYAGDNFRQLDVRKPIKPLPSPQIDAARTPFLKPKSTALASKPPEPSSYKDYEQLVLNAYANQNFQLSDQPIDHSVLNQAVDQLCQQQREYDALKLVRTVYTSVSTSFEYSLYMKWLNLTVVLRDPQRFREACWAIVDDTDPKLPLDAAFNLQVRIGNLKTHSDVRYKNILPPQDRELSYLIHRIKHRSWVLNGRPKTASDRGLWRWSTSLSVLAAQDALAD